MTSLTLLTIYISPNETKDRKDGSIANSSHALSEMLSTESSHKSSKGAPSSSNLFFRKRLDKESDGKYNK